MSRQHRKAEKRAGEDGGGWECDAEHAEEGGRRGWERAMREVGKVTQLLTMQYAPPGYLVSAAAAYGILQAVG